MPHYACNRCHLDQLAALYWTKTTCEISPDLFKIFPAEVQKSVNNAWIIPNYACKSLLIKFLETISFIFK